MNSLAAAAIAFVFLLATSATAQVVFGPANGGNAPVGSAVTATPTNASIVEVVDTTTGNVLNTQAVAGGAVGSWTVPNDPALLGHSFVVRVTDTTTGVVTPSNPYTIVQ